MVGIVIGIAGIAVGVGTAFLVHRYSGARLSVEGVLIGEHGDPRARFLVVEAALRGRMPITLHGKFRLDTRSMWGLKPKASREVPQFDEGPTFPVRLQPNDEPTRWVWRIPPGSSVPGAVEDRKSGYGGVRLTYKAGASMRRRDARLLIGGGERWVVRDDALVDRFD